KHGKFSVKEPDDAPTSGSAQSSQSAQLLLSVGSGHLADSNDAMRQVSCRLLVREARVRSACAEFPGMPGSPDRAPRSLSAAASPPRQLRLRHRRCPLVTPPLRALGFPQLS